MSGRRLRLPPGLRPLLAPRPLLLLGLVVATVVIFAPMLGFHFVDYDDNIYVTENPNLALGLGRAGLRWALAPYETNWIPLTWLSLLLDHALYGLEPGGYHATNLLLHAASVAALFWTLARATGAPGRSAFVAAVFAWHPLHVESVAWVAERKDVLAGLFWMLALVAWVAYARRPGLLRWSAAFAALAASLLAKGLAVTLPCVLLLLDFWPLRRLTGPDGRLVGARVGRALLEKLPMAALAAVLAVVTYRVQSERGAMAGLELIPLSVRIENALVSYVLYLRDAVWPTGLAVFYPHPMEPLPGWQWAGAAALLAALTALALAGWRRRPWLTVGWLWYLGTLVPMIGLVQVGMQARADRYTYIPLIGLAIALAWGVHELVARHRTARTATALGAGLALALLAGATRAQLAYWRDADSLFARALAVTRDNFVAENALGQRCLRRGDVDCAIAHLAEAVRMRPRWGAPRAALADALARNGQLDEAVWSYGEAVRWNADDAELRARYGNLLLERGWNDEALVQFRAALRLADDDAKKARAHAMIGGAWLAKGDTERALAEYEKALALDPDLAEARANLALARLRAGDPEAAARSLQAALDAGADQPEVHLGLADALAQLGRDEEAAAQFRAALAARPAWAEAANNLAWLLAHSDDPHVRDPVEAVRQAEVAAGATGRRDPNVLDTLAAAQAAAGRPDAAAATLDEALARAAEAGDEDALRTLREHRRALATSPRE